ncbi:hypothetical protein PMAC_000059 [Pneumocystis sp. 'macacae']|nr:hypothetical protein PMAC_000059 [Pneumocystis sp. 'macacae']
MFKVGIGCLFIATKLTSDFIVSRKKFLKVCGLKKVDQFLKLGVITSHKENKRQKIRCLAMSYFDDVFTSIRYLAYRSSEIVAACLWLAIIEVLSYPISLFAIVNLVKTRSILCSYKASLLSFND